MSVSYRRIRCQYLLTSENMRTLGGRSVNGLWDTFKHSQWHETLRWHVEEVRAVSRYGDFMSHSLKMVGIVCDECVINVLFHIHADILTLHDHNTKEARYIGHFCSLCPFLLKCVEFVLFLGHYVLSTPTLYRKIERCVLLCVFSRKDLKLYQYKPRPVPQS